MENKSLKGIKFPGMDYYYIIPEANVGTDASLSTSGMAADAAAVGNALQNKVSVVEGSRLMTAEEANKLAKLVIDENGNAWFAGAVDCEDAVTTLDNLKALNLAHVPDDDTDHLIPENADLNDYITPGAYRCATATTAKTLSNMTSYTSAGFRLIVSGTSTANGSVQFIIFNSGVGRLWFRIRTGIDTWGDWKRILTSDDTTGSGSSTDLSDLTEQIESKLEMKLLWINASYTSPFAPQTRKISNLSDYDLVFIVALVNTDNTARVSPVLVKVPTSTGAYLHVAVGAGANTLTATRKIEEITSSTIKFSGTSYSSSPDTPASANNHYCIPYRIYGLKGVQ